MNPRSTDCKADALTTTPSCQVDAIAYEGKGKPERVFDYVQEAEGNSISHTPTEGYSGRDW